MKRIAGIIAVIVLLACIYHCARSEETVSFPQGLGIDNKVKPADINMENQTGAGNVTDIGNAAVTEADHKADTRNATGMEDKNKSASQTVSTVIGDVTILEKALDTTIRVDGWDRTRTWDLRYPFLDGEAVLVLDKINEQVYALVKEKGMPDSEGIFSAEMAYEITYIDERFVSIRFNGNLSGSGYSEGCWGMNFDLETGELLSLEDYYEWEELEASLIEAMEQDQLGVWILNGYRLLEGEEKKEYLHKQFIQQLSKDGYIRQDDTGFFIKDGYLYFITAPYPSCKQYTYVQWETEDFRNKLRDNLPIPDADSMREELLRGDFAHLRGEYSDFRKTLEVNWEQGESEWRLIDLNGDGTDDFILQEKKPVGDTEQKRILGIFTITEDGIRCIAVDFADGTEYSFCGITGKLMYTAPNYGGIIDNEPFEHYHYDEEWQRVTDYKLEILRLDSEVDEELAQKWKHEHPDMAEDGLYYFRYVGDETEKLIKEEWIAFYESETGLQYDGSDLEFSCQQ